MKNIKAAKNFNHGKLATKEEKVATSFPYERRNMDGLEACFPT